MTTTHESTPKTMTIEELRAEAAAVADALKAAAAQAAPAAGAAGSRHRGLPEELRRRFINVRGALFARGVYDPVLVRFDTATGTQASTADVAEQLATVAASIT